MGWSSLHGTSLSVSHSDFRQPLYISLFVPYSTSRCVELKEHRDPDGQPKLSPEQIKVAPVWRRPQELEDDVVSLSSDRPRRGLLPQDILQHIVTDCSVCASISVCLEHARRFGSNVRHKRAVSLSSLSGFCMLVSWRCQRCPTWLNVINLALLQFRKIRNLLIY
jgi:hypothetical protein